MLLVKYNVRCGCCGTRIPMAVEQTDHFGCDRCGRRVFLCPTCRSERACTRCGVGTMETEAERLRRRFPGMMF